MALPAPGTEAPAFSLPNQDGDLVSLADFPGNYVLLWWYPKADTPGWTIEGKGFRDRILDFADSNAVILGISTDTSAENKAFRSKFEFPYDLLSDVDTQMSAAYGAVADGATRASRVSILIAPDRRIAAVYSKVSPAEHADEVLQDLARFG